MSAAAGAFEAEFRRPEMVDTLHELLNLAERTATFARVESIFQSSGWGKSRTICELWRRDVWVIYCSLGQGSGYPRRSAIADWFLQQTSSMISADLDGQLKCMAFCLAYFEAALTELLNHCPGLTPRRFVRMMYKSGDRHVGGEDAQAGERFWQLVKERMTSLLPEYAAEGLLTAHGTTRGQCWRDWEMRAAMRMGSVIERVGCELLKPDDDDDMEADIDRSSSVQVLFVFDEASILTPAVPDKNIYQPLQRAASAFSPLSGVFVLFADTAGTADTAADRISSICDPSDRMPGTNLTLATPIWSCFWADHGVADWSSECARRGISEHNVLSEYWPLRYGRPLWWYVFKSISGGKRPGLNLVLSLACDKLLGGDSGGYAKHVAGGARLSPEMAIAVLGCRCALTVDPRCSAVSALVSGFLMTLLKVDDSRLYADWPMEPIVAWAASRIMLALHAQQRAREELYFPLAMAMKKAWIFKGCGGEVLDRIILLRAFDKATAKSRQTFCSLDAWIEELLGTPLLNLIAERTGEVADDNLKELARSKLCFTAFHKIHKRSCELTGGDFEAAAERRCAVVSEDHDHFIMDETGAVKVHNQVKLRESDTAVAELAREAPPFCGLPKTSCFLSLHMNLLSMDDKVTVVDPVRLENTVRSSSGNKVVRAVLEREAEQRGEKKTSPSTHWSEYQKRLPRQFGAWESWLSMPRKNQVIVKVRGLGVFKHLLDQEVLDLLRDMSMDTSPQSLDPSDPFQSLQKGSLASMFPGKNLV